MRRKSKASSATAASSTGTTRARRTMFGLGCLCVLGLAAFLGSSAPTVGAAESFPGQGFLPDNRAWEMVSPPDKNGGNVGATSYDIHAAADGDAATFASTVASGDTRGSTTAVEYMARRDGAPGTNGWSTHAITPQQSPFVPLTTLSNQYPGYQGDFSPDLSHAVYRSLRPLTEDQSAAFAPNLYLRSDLQSPGAGSYQLLTDSIAPASSLEPGSMIFEGQPAFDGASSDFSHVIFESHLGLTEEGPSAPQLGPVKLYENSGGTVRVVGRVPVEPATSCDDAGPPAEQCVQAESSQAGIQGGGVGGVSDSQYSARMISADGSRIFFQTPPAESGGNIYMREDGTKTFQLNASETEPPVPPSPSGQAQLWDASRDGSRVFFTTGESLVEGDEDGGNSDLYTYEVDRPEGERLTLLSVDHEPADTGSFVTSVIGASDDGHYVYFVSDGQLVAGGPTPVFRGLYLWHDGQISYIGEFGEGSLATRNTPLANTFGSTLTKTSRVTPDGRHLLFMTEWDDGFEGIGGFGGYEQGSGCAVGLDLCHRELYTYNAETAQLRCASCNPTGAAATVDALTDVQADPGAITTTTHLSHALSDGGRYVFFSSAERLVPQDTNGTSDAYEYDTATEEPHLLSSGQDKSPSYFMDASADGHDAFFATAEQLSGWDTDTSYDLYDARVDGGLPEPVPPPPSCQGDSCQPAPRQLNDPTPGSSTLRGADYPQGRKPRQRCASGKRRVKARGGKSRCVRRHSNHKRTAKNNRRAGR